MKIFTTIIMTTLVVLFAIQNFDHVSIFFFTGKPIQMRLIFVIAISGAAGYLIRYLLGIAKEEELKKLYRAMRIKDKKRQQNGHNHMDDEL